MLNNIVVAARAWRSLEEPLPSGDGKVSRLIYHSRTTTEANSARCPNCPEFFRLPFHPASRDEKSGSAGIRAYFSVARKHGLTGRH